MQKLGAHMWGCQVYCTSEGLGLSPHGELHDGLCHDRVGLNNLANEFCCKDISYTLNAEATEAMVSLSNKTEKCRHVQTRPESVK